MERKMYNKMGLDNGSFADLCAVVHDSLVDITFDEDPDREPTDHYVICVIALLPKYIFLEVEQWGAQDTCVREKIYEEVEKVDNFIKTVQNLYMK